MKKEASPKKPLSEEFVFSADNLSLEDLQNLVALAGFEIAEEEKKS